MKPYYYYFPYIPIIGVPLAFYYHISYGNTCLEGVGKHFFLSMFVQTVSFSIPLIFILLHSQK